MWDDKPICRRAAIKGHVLAGHNQAIMTSVSHLLLNRPTIGHLKPPARFPALDIRSCHFSQQRTSG